MRGGKGLSLPFWWTVPSSGILRPRDDILVRDSRGRSGKVLGGNDDDKSGDDMSLAVFGFGDWLSISGLSKAAGGNMNELEDLVGSPLSL